MNEELQMYSKVTEGCPTEFGYGPEWVAMAMFMDDFPKLYSEEEAKRYWETRLKRSLKHD